MKSEIKNGVLVVTLENSLIGSHVNDPFVDLIKTSLEAGNKKVLVNLSAMKYIDSTGLGALLSATSKTKNAGGKLALCHVPEQMKKLIQMTKLESIFTQEADEASGLNFLTQ